METISTTELDALLTAMIGSAEGISDLLFVANRPPQMEIHGKIRPFFSLTTSRNTGGNCNVSSEGILDCSRRSTIA